MEHFRNEFSSIPVLVCLTHADKLYQETFKDFIPTIPSPRKTFEIKDSILSELKVRIYWLVYFLKSIIEDNWKQILSFRNV